MVKLSVQSTDDSDSDSDHTSTSHMYPLATLTTVEYAAKASPHDMLSCNWVAKSAKVVEIVFSIVPTSTHFNYFFWRTPGVTPFCVVGPT